MESMTIKDIAKKCGVGISTVSRAINNHPDINPETKKMIMQVIADNNYVPNNSARNLKRSDAKAIAVLINGIANPFFTAMIKVMEAEIERKKYSLVLHHVEAYENEVSVALELVKEKRLRGIVFLGGAFRHTKEQIKQLNVPFVLSTIGMTEAVKDAECSMVSVNDYVESYKMVDYLCKLGHKKIVLLAGEETDVGIGKLRLDGYRQALRDNQIEPDEQMIAYMYNEEDGHCMKNGYAAMQSILDRKIEFTAVYAISDTLALGACKALTNSGRKIPEDVSVAGYDGIDAGYYYNPSLTTIKQPVEEIAKESIKFLFDAIKKKQHHQLKEFHADLFVGESTRAI